MKKLVLLGAGGHCESVLDVILSRQEFDDIAILDRPEKVGQDIFGIPIVGTDEKLAQLYAQGYRYAFITVGSIKNTDLRRRLYDLAFYAGFEFINVIDQSAILAKDVRLGKGIFIGKKAVINSGVNISDQTIINTGAIIEHNCFVGMFSHVSVGAVICGSVTIGKDCFIGANATIIQEVQIGKNAIIGAGSVVIENVPDNGRVVGLGGGNRQFP